MAQTDNFTLLAGGHTRGADPHAVDLVIDLARSADHKDYRSTTAAELNDQAKRHKEFANIVTKSKVHPPAVISIEWRDYGAPDLNRAFWNELAAAVQEFAAHRKNTRILVCCQGGHGRTGTALAILTTLWGIADPRVSPVAWVRKEYCENAVESVSQLDYIERILGIKIPDDIPQAKKGGGKVTWNKEWDWQRGVYGDHARASDDFEDAFI